MPWYQIILRIAFRIMKYGYLRYCVSLVSPLQSPRQFIHNRLNEPQRKSLIKAPRENERGRVTRTYIKNFQRNQPDSRWTPSTGRIISISKSARLHASVREEEAEKEAEEGGRRGEREGEKEKSAARRGCHFWLAPADDVRRDFLFGPAQPRGSPLLF